MNTARCCRVGASLLLVAVAAGFVLATAGIAQEKKKTFKDLSPEELKGLQKAISEQEENKVKCANLTYAGKQSKCFSDNFLRALEEETTVETAKGFESVKLADEKLFSFPFAVMTGEGAFALSEQERVNLKSYLVRGGFLLASAGCSSQEWDQSFRREIKRVFPEYEVKKIPLEHAIFGMVFDISTIRLRKSSGTATLEGLEIDGRLVMVYSPEGLNDTEHAGKGCCCCGGNEIQNSREINANIMAYALTH